MKRKLFGASAVITASVVLLSGCGRTGYEGFEIPKEESSIIVPVSSNSVENHYEGVEPTIEEPLRTERSADGLCTIEVKESYYDVTLDYEKGSYYDVGKAYGETILAVIDDYGSMSEQYLFENIKAQFTNLNGDYSSIKDRCDVFYKALYKNYKEELDGFTDAISGNSEGIAQDGILSVEEARLVQFIPDAVRGTSCSGISLNGSMTASGSRITSRILEWDLGSENQLCIAHSLVHYVNGDKSFNSVTYLGFFPILTAVNDDGVMLSEYDVGSAYGEPYTYGSKKSYTYDMRYVLENYKTAKECASFLKNNALNYPYCVNVLASDENEALVTEIAVETKDGTALIRDSSTKLMDGVEWSDPDCICVVNSFAADGNSDMLSATEGNTIRWKKYAKLFCGQKNITTGRFKELLTSERIDENLENIRSTTVVHMVIADYSAKKLQAVFTGQDGVVDSPEFIDLGSWEYSR